LWWGCCRIFYMDWSIPGYASFESAAECLII
jgi:hypothetical protein